jgi:3'-5' exoribonuclease
VRRFIGVLRTIRDPWLKQLIDSFLNDSKFMDKYTCAAAGKRWHHAYPGGLAQHCYEMTRIADVMCELFPAINRDVLLAGIFLHDLGKTEELSQGLYIDYTTVGKLVGHLAIGLDMANEKIRAIEGFPDSVRMEIQHMILSHHATLDQGSPIVPKTLEAMVLALIDDLDAQTDAFNRVIDETRSKGRSWSEFLPIVDRQIWARRQAPE